MARGACSNNPSSRSLLKPIHQGKSTTAHQRHHCDRDNSGNAEGSDADFRVLVEFTTPSDSSKCNRTERVAIVGDVGHQNPVCEQNQSVAEGSKSWCLVV